MTALNFPVALDCLYVGIAKASGSFLDKESGEVVEFSDALGFDYEDAEGITQRLVIRSKKLVELDVRPERLIQYQSRLRIQGDVVLGEGNQRSFFRPVKAEVVEQAKPSTGKAA